MRLARIALLLLLIYLALTANLEWRNIVVGALLAFGVSLLLRPSRRAFDARRLPGALLALAGYLGVLVVDLIQSGVQAARIVLSPSLPIQPGIVAIPALTDSEMATALSAHALSVTPGELVVEIGEDNTFFVHCLDVTHGEEYKVEAQRLRRDLLRRIFE